MNLVYLAHDLNDPAIHRRVRMLRAGGLRNLTVAGFHRAAPAPALIEGMPVAVLGRTADARLVRRIGSVAAAAAGLGRHRALFAGADVILARQLEMLVLGALARRHAPAAALVYECLDVHRLLAEPGRAGGALRALEGRLLAGCDLLMVSSPAFLREHFARAHARLPPALVVENKVLAAEVAPGPPDRAPGAPLPSPPVGPPWRIGWFGVIRCARSLGLLADLVRRLPGRVEVEIRGRPAHTAIPDFDAVVAATPGLSFLGPYDRARDLGAMYGGVHLTWAMDFYEAGANSDWLLPNRVYEGGLHGTVPIAQASVETGRWLAGHGAGLLLDEPLDETLPALLERLDAPAYADARAAAARVPRSALVDGPEDCRALVARLAALPAARAYALRP